MLAATFANGFAVGGMDLALHDLWGKALGVPVHVLYGGALRHRVPAYASLPGYFDAADRGPEVDWVAEAKALVGDGFRALKFRIGRFSAARELPVLASVRDAVGPGVRLRADANAAYSAGTALRVGRALRELEFDWLEEPLPQAGYAGYPELRTRPFRAPRRALIGTHSPWPRHRNRRISPPPLRRSSLKGRRPASLRSLPTGEDVGARRMPHESR
jgi:D-galactarolactone cycloisomerase